MPQTDSSLDPKALARARKLLKSPEKRESAWRAVGAATLLAITAIAFATSMVIAPPVVDRHVAIGAP